MSCAIVSVLLSFAGISIACGQQSEDTKTSSTRSITSEFLLAHGFKQSATKPHIYTREHARLADVARDLGFSLKSLQPTVGQDSGSDVRTVDVDDSNFVVRSEVRDKNGHIIPGSLDDPDAICTISVSLRQAPVREFLKTDSSPRLRIMSVAVPEDRSEPLQVEFELAATGKKPVAILQSNFHVDLRGDNLLPGQGFGYPFPEGTPKIVIVSPGKPAVFKLSVPVVDAVGRLSSGKYTLRLRIQEFRGGRQPQSYDYEWEGREHHSNDFKFVIE